MQNWCVSEGPKVTVAVLSCNGWFPFFFFGTIRTSSNGMQPCAKSKYFLSWVSSFSTMRCLVDVRCSEATPFRVSRQLGCGGVHTLESDQSLELYVSGGNDFKLRRCMLESRVTRLNTIPPTPGKVITPTATFPRGETDHSLTTPSPCCATSAISASLPPPKFQTLKDFADPWKSKF